jgi:tetratricopeptide (TPR) repeat protein
MAMRLAVGAALAIAVPIAAAAPRAQTQPRTQTPGDEARYDDCMSLANRDPAAAAQVARDWRAQGGGFPARHCAAAALEQAGEFVKSGTALEALVRDMPAGDRRGLRAGILAQAGRVWLRANEVERAYDAFNAALAIRPGESELRLQRGLANALLGRYFDAIDDLNAVIDREPANGDALVLRATAYRQLGSVALATDDVERALASNPDHPDALLERGILRQLANDGDGARQDWQRLIRLAPKSEAAQAARENLENLKNTTD